MKLSIIIANYNTYRLTKSCIESIFKHNPSFKFEVIVIDDFSPDKSGTKLKLLETKYKNLTVILNKKNLGYVRSNNLGLKKSVGEFKLLLNSDTVIHKNSIESLVKFAENTPDAGVVGSKLLNIDGSLQSSCYNLPTLKNAILMYFLGKKGLFDKFAPNSTKPTEVEAVVGASFLITPQAYKLVGGLNEKYKSYFEDLDYCREVMRKGLKIYYLPESIVTHYHGASFGQLLDKDNQWRKLIPSSIVYHGLITHYLIYIVSWTGQKWNKLMSRQNA